MFVPLLLETPKIAARFVSDKYSVSPGWQNKALVHSTKPKFTPEKNLFAAIRETWNLIARCQENAYILALEFSNFSGGGLASTPVPEILDPPLIMTHLPCEQHVASDENTMY
jgi:hypothetical protein